MIWRSNFQLSLIFCITATTTYSQNDKFPLLSIGDPAPVLRLREWIKGAPIQQFERGNVYVVEFWATWCKPCIAAMPHLSVLACEYKDKVTILGIDIYEKKTTSMEKVRAFVDSMGHLMDYNVAAADTSFMEAAWFNASGEEGIPITFVVNAEGRLVWIGSPKGLDEVLPKVVNNTWDIEETLAKRKLEKHLEEQDNAAREELNKYLGNPRNPDDLGKPDSALLVINEIVRKEPKLKYAPNIAFHTVSSLLKTNLQKAYVYGKEVLMTSTKEEPLYQSIIEPIKWYSNKLNLPVEIYALGAEAYQAKIDHNPESANISSNYHKMAEWYWRAGDKLKAIVAQQKAIELLKRKKDFSAGEIAAFEARLQKYKNM